MMVLLDMMVLLESLSWVPNPWEKIQYEMYWFPVDKNPRCISTRLHVMSDPVHACKVHTRIFVYSHPRTRSNLFMKLLETHPHVMAKSYPFMWAFQNGPDRQWSEKDAAIRLKASGQTKELCEKKYSNATYQSGLDDIERLIAKASAEASDQVLFHYVWNSTTLYRERLAL